MSSGHLLKLLRIAKQFSQKTVAEKLSITQQAYSKIESSEYVDKATTQKVLSVLSSTYQDLEKLSMILPPPRKTN